MFLINKIIKSICVALSVLFFFSAFPVGTSADEDLKPFELDCKSALLMEQQTGTVLYEKNADSPYPPASVTKIMTLLLIVEDIENGKISLSDEVTVSENAAGMGGSQIFLEPNEKMSVDDLLKAVAVASANDAATALAEHVCGSVDAFVKRMNERASELGMRSANFENATGLDDATVNHILSAKDIAIMSRELLKHKMILQYTTIWMDSVRNGQFGLTNTNRLIRFYPGANGLKTGSTSKAKFCISATAERDGMQLIAVIMGAPTRDVRNECAKKLLDYGFANYSVVTFEGADAGKIRVKGGKEDTVDSAYDTLSLLVEKGKSGNLEQVVTPYECIDSPVEKGQKTGDVVYLLNGNEIARQPIYAKESVDSIGWFGMVLKLLQKMTFKK